MKRRQGEDMNQEEEVDRETSVMPNILEIQMAIANVAASCGRPPKRFSTELQGDHEAVQELEEAMAERTMTTDGLERFFLSRRVGDAEKGSGGSRQ